MDGRSKYPVIDGIKQCTKCKIFFPVNNFYCNYKKEIVHAHCKDCHRIRRNLPEVKRRDVEVRTATRIKRVYNMTITEYNELFAIQGGRCAICNKPEMKKKGNLCIDHCHTTTKNRSLLCRSCNLALGNMKDSPELLRKAAEYIELYKVIHER